jgi:hypothetical protein
VLKTSTVLFRRVMIVKKMFGFLIDDRFVSHEELALEFEKLQVENKKLRKIIHDLVITGMDSDIAERLEEIDEE